MRNMYKELIFPFSISLNQLKVLLSGYLDMKNASSSVQHAETAFGEVSARYVTLWPFSGPSSGRRSQVGQGDMSVMRYQKLLLSWDLIYHHK